MREELALSRTILADISGQAPDAFAPPGGFYSHEVLWDRQYFFPELTPAVYDIHPDGERFLMIKDLEEGDPAALLDDVIVVENFFEELNRIAPTPKIN